MTETPTITPVGYDSKIEGNVVITKLDAAINWMRKNSLWPMPMGLACCAIELMATCASRFGMSRFGMEVSHNSPRQSDVMIVAGTVTYKVSDDGRTQRMSCGLRHSKLRRGVQIPEQPFHHPSVTL